MYANSKGRQVVAGAIYARISEDRDYTGIGVQRQVRECRKRAKELGWDIAVIYEDNDASAYNTRQQRQGYASLCDDIRNGRVDGLIVWHHDRLFRRSRDLESFLDLIERADFPIKTVQGGDLDLSTSSGKAVARMFGAMATHESEHKGERVRSAAKERAEQGRAHGGSRPYGYEPNGMKVRTSEAKWVRLIAKRIIAGESLGALCEYLNDKGARTATGKEWRVSRLRSMMVNARYSGQRERDGEIIGPAAWPAIITPEQTTAIRGILNDPKRKTNRAPRRYLLTGLLKCSGCGLNLQGQPVKLRRTYVCKKGLGTHRCGTISIGADGVEQFLTEVLFAAFDGSRLDRIAAQADIEEPDNAAPALKVRLDMFTDMLAAGDMSRDDYTRATAKVRAELRALERQSAARHTESSVSMYIGDASRLRREWPSLSLGRQQAIMQTVFDHVDVLPRRRGGKSVPVDRLDAVWRV